MAGCGGGTAARAVVFARGRDEIAVVSGMGTADWKKMSPRVNIIIRPKQIHNKTHFSTRREVDSTLSKLVIIVHCCDML